MTITAEVLWPGGSFGPADIECMIGCVMGSLTDWSPDGQIRLEATAPFPDDGQMVRCILRSGGHVAFELPRAWFLVIEAGRVFSLDPF